MIEDSLDKSTRGESIGDYLKHAINKLLGKSKESTLSENLTLTEMGLDSSDFVVLSDQLTVKFNKELTTTFFFQYNTIPKIISFFTGEKKPNQLSQSLDGFSPQVNYNEKKPASIHREQDIAIVGMACRLPGKNNSSEALWNFLKEGKSAINVFPKDRGQWPEEIESKYEGIDRGAFLEDIQYFDAEFFRISPEEAKLMDPRQRILLELSWELLNNCGYDVGALSESKTGVFIGASGLDYRLCIEKSKKNKNAHLATGNSMAMLSNRLSYFYDLRGPSIVIDTACSSSLVAVHQAIRALRSKECDQALVGGINIICNLNETFSYYDAGLLSKNGECKVFDDDADGYVRSEGAAILMLKPLQKAINDNDVIHAVIKGSASSHGGKSSGLTVPHPQEQIKLLQDAWVDANVDPRTISYIEAHGTGTKLGDAIELFGIKNAFLEKSSNPQKCGIGSLKSNFGHMEAAGGIVGLLKIVLSLQHQFLPASINFKKINSQIEWEPGPFHIVQNSQVWREESFGSRSLKRAGVSSFGSGGTNAHVILEEYKSSQSSSNRHNTSPYPFKKKYYWYDESSNVNTSVGKSYSEITQTHSYPSLEERNCSFLQELIAGQMGCLPQEVDRQSGFFDLGLTSHQILKLCYDIEQKTEEKFSPNLFFIHQNIANLARFFSKHDTEKFDLILKAQKKYNITSNSADRYKPFPFNDIQEAFFSGRQVDSSQKVGAHIYLEFDVKGFEIYRLNTAWKRLLDHHDMLRAMMLPNGQQQILETLPIYQIKVSDFRAKSESQQHDSLKAIRERMSHRLYGPDEWPLFEICISITPEKQTMHFSIDEMIVDAFSLRLILDQWLQLYKDPKTELPKLNLSFRDYIVAIKNFENSALYNNDLKYWVKRLDSLPFGPQIPVKNESNSTNANDFRRARLEGILSNDKWQAIKEQLSLWHVTPTVFVLTLFSEILRKWSKEKNFSLILTFFNRLIDPQLELICGPFISTSLFIAKEQENVSFIQIAQQNQKELFEDLAHLNVSGIRVMRELKNRKQIPHVFSLPVVFTSLLGFEKLDTKTGFLDRINFSVTQTPQVYFDHQVYEHQGELRFSWDVAEEYFAKGIIKTIFQDYCHALEKIGDNPEKYFTVEWRFAKNVDENREKTFNLEVFPGQSMEPFPLTDQQQAYAFGQSDYGAKLTSKIYTCFEAERLDIYRLEQAWQRVIDDHPMLRTIINLNGTQQVLKNTPTYHIKVHDLKERQEINSLESLILSRNKPLDQWPYFDLQVTRINEVKSLIHLSIELIIADSPSIEILKQQLFYYYQSPHADLPKNTITFYDYVLSHQQYEKTENYQKSMQYWQNKFADISPGPILPILNNARVSETYRLEGVLENWNALKIMAKNIGASPNIILLTAFAEILAAWSTSDQFSIVIPSWERLPIHSEINQIVGDFTSMSWLEVFKQNITLKEKILQYQEQVNKDLLHKDVSGLKVLRKINSKRRNLNFPYVFTDIHDSSDLIYPANIKFKKSLSQTPQVYLDNLSYVQDQRLNLCWDVGRDVFPEGTIEEMFNGYQKLLNDLIADPQNFQEGDFELELMEMQNDH